ncbi:MAG: Rne/Rng family ribonuclease, partial [Deltaproteobacteria bacterium HGW-Deltaproteobacteria-22]
SQEHADRIQQFMHSFMPQAQDRIHVYTEPMPVFDHFDIETQIRQALAQKVWLRSGGYLVFQRTEALTTIDVNTGGYVGQRTLEDTITQTNLEAAKEIPRQLRLRNIGGLVVIDFIDMEAEANQQKVMQVFTESLSFDRARHMVLPISQFGLMQLTRQRTRESLLTLMTSSCPYCEGKGFNRSLSSLCSEIIREIIRKSSLASVTHLKISCHPDVADALAHEFGNWLENLEERFQKAYNVHAVEHMHLEDFDVHPVMDGEHTAKIQMPTGPGL